MIFHNHGSSWLIPGYMTTILLRYTSLLLWWQDSRLLLATIPIHARPVLHSQAKFHQLAPEPRLPAPPATVKTRKLPEINHVWMDKENCSGIEFNSALRKWSGWAGLGWAGLEQAGGDHVKDDCC